MNYSGSIPPETKFLKTWVTSAYNNTQEVSLPSQDVPMAINKYVANHINTDNVTFVSTELIKSNGAVYDDIFVLGD